MLCATLVLGGVPQWASGYPILSGPNAILPNEVVAIDGPGAKPVEIDGR